MEKQRRITILLFLLPLLNGILSEEGPYYGTNLGNMELNLNDVKGTIYAVDENTIFIKGFSFDGQAPDAYFWAGTSNNPDVTGFIVPDEKGSTKPLGQYYNKDVVLRLPEGKTLQDITWISIWSRKMRKNYGYLMMPQNLMIPTPVEIRPLSQLAHGLKSGPITIVDAQTFLITDFHYDGLGPAGYWWATPGARPSSSGIQLKDENGSNKPMRRYNGETVVISLPQGSTIYDFDWLGVWCSEFQVDFGSTRIPQNIRVPPSPRMLGIEPESKLNCEVLNNGLGFEVRWVIDGDDIVMQLVGKIERGDYMAFGLSKDDSKSSMIGADAVVAWYDSNGRGHAVDYYLGSKEQCTGTRGSCPDVKHPGASDSITLLHSAVVNGFTLITFKRPQLGVDEKLDQHVYSDGNQAVIWAIGSLNDRNEVSYHRMKSKGNLFLDFARSPKWNCPNSQSNGQRGGSSPSARSSSSSPRSAYDSVASPSTSSTSTHQHRPRDPNAWKIPSIVCPADNTFRAQIGPTGGKKGYEAITGKIGWGISWYINGLVIPEITVERGKTYTFIVEGGNDKIHGARRHPLYITDSPEGGFDHKPDDERRKERIFAGVGITKSGELLPTAAGRLCEWQIDTSRKDKPEDYKDFFEFQRTLSLQCGPGEPALLRWRPDKNTPDTVYYQCYTHRYLGWKIRVVDSCDQLASASITKVYHTPADNATVYRHRNPQSLDNSNTNHKESTSRRGIIQSKSVNSAAQSILARPRSKESSNNFFESLRYQAPAIRKPDFLTLGPAYSPYHSSRIQPIVMPNINANVYQSPMSSLHVPIGPVRPLDVFVPPPFGPNPIKKGPVYIKQRLPPPIPPNPPKFFQDLFRPSPFPHFPTDFSRVPAPFSIPTTWTTTTTTVKPTTKPSITSTTPKTIKTKATTKTPTTIADHLIGGFLPVLINSKGTPPSSSPVEISSVSDAGTSLNGTTKFEAIHFSSSNEPTKTTIQASDLNLEDRQPSKPSAYSKSKVEYFGYKPTSDQNEWEDGGDNADGTNDKHDHLSSTVANSSTKEKEESAITVIDTSIPSTQVIHKIVNDSNGVRLENIYPIVDNNNSKKSISSSSLSSSSSKSINSTSKSSEADIVGKASTSVPINSNISLKNTTTSHADHQPHIETKFAANGTISVHSSSHSNDHDPIPEGIEDEGDENIAPLIPNDFTPANGTDDAILSHIMSLISDNSIPPEVKIVSRSDGNTVQSTHVEIHHNLKKRSAAAFIERRTATLEVDSVNQIPSKEKLAMNSAISRSFSASFSLLCWNLLSISLARCLLSTFS
ncbi:protein Skeletor, isoforms B/C-like [Brevipalpus obovatus]|uniref:protein Skeletor, isoforms B/C-like n=1 Tax=Brevipalpus obovatus TaxID=246614 RepID=UPI003D9E861E